MNGVPWIARLLRTKTQRCSAAWSLGSSPLFPPRPVPLRLIRWHPFGGCGQLTATRHVRIYSTSLRDATKS